MIEVKIDMVLQRSYQKFDNNIRRLKTALEEEEKGEETGQEFILNTCATNIQNTQNKYCHLQSHTHTLMKL